MTRLWTGLRRATHRWSRLYASRAAEALRFSGRRHAGRRRGRGHLRATRRTPCSSSRWAHPSTAIKEQLHDIFTGVRECSAPNDWEWGTGGQDQHIAVGLPYGLVGSRCPTQAKLRAHRRSGRASLPCQSGRGRWWEDLKRMYNVIAEMRTPSSWSSCGPSSLSTHPNEGFDMLGRLRPDPACHQRRNFLRADNLKCVGDPDTTLAEPLCAVPNNYTWPRWPWSYRTPTAIPLGQVLQDHEIGRAKIRCVVRTGGGLATMPPLWRAMCRGGRGSGTLLCTRHGHCGASVPACVWNFNRTGDDHEGPPMPSFCWRGATGSHLRGFYLHTERRVKAGSMPEWARCA